ncbi:hypothetical protein, partial [Synechococcus sp. H70.1]
MNFALQARILEAKQLLQQSPDVFAEWLAAFYPQQDPEAWREFLWGLFDLGVPSPAEEEAFP